MTHFRIQHAQRRATGRALLHEVQQAAGQGGPLRRCVQTAVALRYPREEGADKKLRLIKALGGVSGLLQSLEHGGLKRNFMGCTNGIHGIYW